MRAPKAKHTPLNAAVGPRATGDKYQRILDAAVSVFAQKGFHTARVSDVAERASVADGTIYLYFRNKEELLMTEDELNKVWILRKVLAPLSPIDSLELLISKLSATKSNKDFLRSMEMGSDR